MECLNIGATKIKLVLTKAEAEARGVLSDSGVDDTEKRKRFRRILDEAKERFGFDVGREKALVQVYPTKDGGAELFVTKLGILSKEAESVFSRSERFEVLSAKRIFYIFESFEALLGAARSVPPSLTEDSRAYRLESGEYCLSFLERDARASSALAHITEFGRRFAAGEISGLDEHARLILNGDAIERLSGL